MTGTDLCVNKPHCAAAVRPWESEATTEYQNKHYNINQQDEGKKDDRGRDGGTKFILRIKEQETRELFMNMMMMMMMMDFQKQFLRCKRRSTNDFHG